MDGVQFSNPNTSCVGLRSMDIYIVIYIFRYYVFKCQCIEIYSAMTVVIGGSMLANLAAGQNLDTLFDLLKRSRYMVLVLKVLTHLPYMGTSGIGAGVHSSLDHLIRIISADSLPRGGFQPPPVQQGRDLPDSEHLLRANGGENCIMPGVSNPRDPVVPNLRRYDWTRRFGTYSQSVEHITVPEVRYDWIPRESTYRKMGAIKIY